MLIPILVAAAGFYTVETDEAGISALVRPDGSPMYLSGVEYLRKQETHEFANTNWEAEVVSRLKAWNCTALGAGPLPSVCGRGLPYTQIAWIAESMTTSTNADDYVFPTKRHAPCTGFPNVYSPRWEEMARDWAKREVARLKDDAELVGWYLDNELRWHGVGRMSDGLGLYRAFAELPPGHSGRRALDAFLAQRGQTTSNATEAVQREFLEDVSERFFSVACRAVREADPNHLVLGVRFAGFSAPDSAWRACGRWCDVVSFNVYPWAMPDTGEVITQCRAWNGGNMRRKVDGKFALCRRPMMVSEWGTSAIDSGLPCTRAVGQRSRTQRERAAAAERILYEFLSMPYLVGHNWYRYRDNRPDGASRENCNWGLVDLLGRPYPEITEMFTRVNADSMRLHRELSLGKRKMPFTPDTHGTLLASEVARSMESGANAEFSFSAGAKTPVDKITWKGADMGFVDLRVATRRRDGSGGFDWNTFPKAAGAWRGADGTLTVTNELRNPRDGVALRFVTRWRAEREAGRLLGELVSVQNVGDDERTLSRVMLDLVPPFAASAKAENSVYTHFNMTNPLCASTWISPGGVFAGAVSCAPLADEFKFRYSAKAGNGKGWPHPDAGFRFVDFGQEELTLAPGQTWAAEGRIWVVFAFGDGGLSGWYQFRDAFEMKHIGALSRIPDRVEPQCVGSSLVWDFPEWEDDTYVFLPACAYNGNRDMFRLCARSYPPAASEMGKGADPRLEVSEIPALEADGSGEISVTSGDLATPCAGFFFPRARRGFLVYVEQQAGGCNVGLTVRAGRLTVDCPARRAKSYRLCRQWADSPDGPPPGEDAPASVCEYRTFSFAAQTVGDFFEKFFRTRKCLMWGKRSRPSFSAAWATAERFWNSTNAWNGSFYSPESTDRWAPGWTGGMSTVYALAKLGSDETRARCARTLDFAVRCQGAAGFFRAQRVGDQPPKTALVRQAAEGEYFLLKALSVMPPREEWDAAARRGADAFVQLWRRHGQIGKVVDADTGELRLGRSCSGALVPAALAEASVRFGSRHYLDAAEEILEDYCRRDLARGVVYGGASDALMAPDSESAASLLESCVRLAEATGKPRWIAEARRAAALLSSWVVSYDYAFPGGSTFRRLGVRTTGAVYANVQNKHAAPGLCTLSPDSLVRLARLTGDDAYRELGMEIAAFIPQCLSTEARPIPVKGTGKSLPPGFINERVNMSDWEGAGRVGEVFYGRCWCCTALLLALADVPEAFAR